MPYKDPNKICPENDTLVIVAIGDGFNKPIYYIANYEDGTYWTNNGSYGRNSFFPFGKNKPNANYVLGWKEIEKFPQQ